MNLKNKDLELYVETVLNKRFEDCTSEDIQKIDVLTYDGNSYSNYLVDLSDLSIFPNVKKIIISDGIVSSEAIQEIKQNGILFLQLNHCVLNQDNDLGELTPLESLELIGSCQGSYDFLEKLNHLKKLVIVNPYADVPIVMDVFEKMDSLECLTLQGCSLDEFSYLSLCKQIKFLNLLESDIPANPVDTFNQMSSLEKLYVSKGHNMKGIKSNVDVHHNYDELLIDNAFNA